MIYGIIIGLITLIAVLLTIVVLLQSGQGQGLSGGIAATGMPGQMMGARRTADILSKTTSVLGGSFLVLCIVANFFIERTDIQRSAIQESGYTAPLNLPQTNLPANAESGAAESGTSSDSEPEGN